MTTEANTPVQEAQHRGIPADTFRARLKLARLHAGDLTIRQAAERCQLNHASWANWEKGMEPRGLVEIVDAISDGLVVDRDWLLFGGALATEVRYRRDRHGRREANHRYLRRTERRHSISRAVACNGTDRTATGQDPNITIERPVRLYAHRPDTAQ